MNTKTEVTIRPENEKDPEEIKRIPDLALNQINESELVEKLRNTPRFVYELSFLLQNIKKGELLSKSPPLPDKPRFFFEHLNDGWLRFGP